MIYDTFQFVWRQRSGQGPINRKKCKQFDTNSSDDYHVYCFPYCQKN